MKKYFLMLGLILCLMAGAAVSQENKGQEPAQKQDSTAGQTESKKDCKKVCVKRDGYGMCTEFEERCEDEQ